MASRRNGTSRRKQAEEGTVYALKDGKRLWEFKAGAEVLASPCPGPYGMVYVADTGRKLYALREPSRDDISGVPEPCEETVPDRVEEEPVIEDGWLIAGHVKLPVNRK